MSRDWVRLPVSRWGIRPDRALEKSLSEAGELLLPKQAVVGSNPIARSRVPPRSRCGSTSRHARRTFERHGAGRSEDEVVGERHHRKAHRRSQSFAQGSRQLAPLSRAHPREPAVGLGEMELPPAAPEAHPQAAEPEGSFRWARRPGRFSAPEEGHLDVAQRLLPRGAPRLHWWRGLHARC